MHATDEDEMTTQQRLAESASTLAAGFLRFKRRTGCLPLPTSESVESSRIPSDSAWQSSETSALCTLR